VKGAPVSRNALVADRPVEGLPLAVPTVVGREAVAGLLAGEAVAHALTSETLTAPTFAGGYAFTRTGVASGGDALAVPVVAGCESAGRGEEDREGEDDTDKSRHSHHLLTW
jgi:hypothetical protein